MLDQMRQRMASLKVFNLWRTIPHAQPNPWFFFIHYDAQRMKLDKEECAKALQAEGIPVTADYHNELIYRQTWIRDQNTFGRSRYPWSLPEAREIEYTNCCPQAENTFRDHMTLRIHEGWTEEQIDYVATTFAKMEKLYRR